MEKNKKEFLNMNKKESQSNLGKLLKKKKYFSIIIFLTNLLVK
jgi:hypothetical protein